MLFIEYDVNPEGEIELVALINAIEEDGEDPDGKPGWPGGLSSKMGAWAVLASPWGPQAHGRDRGPRRTSGHRRAGHPGGSFHQGGGALMSTTRSQLYRFARDLGNVEAVEHGYKRGGLLGAAGGAAQREARRVIYREGNRQINHFVRALGLGPRRR